MKIEAPVILGPWEQVCWRMMNYFDNLPAPGECALSFSELPSFSEFYHVHILLQGDQLNLVVSSWHHGYDFQRSKFEFGFAPSIVTKTAQLSGEEKAGFPEFFEGLVNEKEDHLLDRTMRLLLDGSQFRMRLFRDGISVRSMEWDSAAKPLGLMKQVILLSQSARKNSSKE